MIINGSRLSQPGCLCLCSASEVFALVSNQLACMKLLKCRYLCVFVQVFCLCFSILYCGSTYLFSVLTNLVTALTVTRGVCLTTSLQIA